MRLEGELAEVVALARHTHVVGRDDAVHALVFDEACVQIGAVAAHVALVFLLVGVNQRVLA